MKTRRSVPHFFPFLPACLLAVATLVVPAVAAAQGGGWQVQTLPALPAGSSYSIRAVTALDANQVWVAGVISPGGDGFVASSTDGGATWTIVHRSGTLGGVGRLKMFSSTTGVIGGAYGLLRTTADGGGTWSQDSGPKYPPPGVHVVGPSGHVYGMDAIDINHIWTAGYDGASAGVIFHRVPGRPQGTNTNYPWWLEWAKNWTGMYGLDAVDGQTAWAVGYAGNIWKTADGLTWGQQASGTGATLNDVGAVDTTTAWVVGDGGTILRTGDGGGTWTPQTPPVSRTFKRISAVNASTAWIVGSQGTILVTTDGGTTWTSQRSGTTRTLQAVFAISSTTAWAVGDGGVIVKTTDGGTGAWAAPTVTGIVPNTGGRTLQTPVTITGTGFREPVGVSAGGGWVTDIVCVSTTTITATLGWIAAPGPVDIVVTNDDGQSATLANGFTYTPPPVATRVVPSSGPTTGGTTLTITGSNFTGTSVVGFWTSPPTPLSTTYVSPTTLTAVVPATRADGTPWTEGPEYLYVLNPDGQYAEDNLTFDFYPATITFTDEPITPGVTPVRRVHLIELRERIDMLRARYSLAGYSWTDWSPVAGDTPVRAVHLLELRDALTAVYSEAGRPSPTWAEAIAVGGVIKAAHVTELHAAVRGIW